jgi:hypothetical protein
MFVAGQARAEVSFALAQARLARLAHAGGLLGASQGAYGAGPAFFVPADPPGDEPAAAGLAGAHFGDMIADSDSARMPLRWEAVAPDGDLFPALDADLTLSPAGDQATTLMLAGVFRLLPGTQGNGMDHALVRHVATATIQAFLDRIAAALTVPAPVPEWDGGTTDRGGTPPAAQAP